MHKLTRAPRFPAALLAAALLGPAAPAAAQAPPASFVNFESGQVRPLALTPDGDRLLAVNTPDGRLEIFDLDASGHPTLAASVAVGLEPVAVAVRTNDEAWVVNHLSDSISIVDIGSIPPRVVRTLLVGDEPRDILFAGTGATRAFITAAHRGQNRPGDPQLSTEGIGRSDVWVFDTANLGAKLGGTPLAVVNFFGDTTRALAASPDGSQVWAASFHSGNRTMPLSEGLVCNGGASAGPCTLNGTTVPGGLPGPNANWQGIPGPETGLIVRFDPADSLWKDQLGRDWSAATRFTLPDWDVFRIDANATPPVQLSRYRSVGTILFNMAVNPVNGKIYVTNTEAHNEVRFEGTGEFFGSTTVRGRLHQARITVLDGTSVLPRHLNKHIDYGVVPSPPGVADASLATPTGIAVSADGSRAWVAAFGSSKVGIFDTAELEANTFTPSAASHVELSGGGPSGLVLDEPRGLLYVFTRFDNAISVVDTAARAEIEHVALFNPEPEAVVNGRPFLYDARATSSNGEASCAACHVFGDLDDLGWDLGDPDGTFLKNPNPIEFNVGQDPDFHPLKGPMTTQSLRGMAGSGPLHWRGDRTAGNDPGGDPLDSKVAFEKFNPAFVGLLGRATELPDADMEAFADFILTVKYPPNPIRALDNVLTQAQAAGRALYMNVPTDVVRTCDGCHVLDPSKGFFGADGETTFEGLTQMFKVPHLRNAYTKVGMFGMARVSGVNPGGNGSKGAQIRGFGYSHDGSVDTLQRFFSASVFGTTDSASGAFAPLTTEEKQNLEAFVLAFDTDYAPVLGQQVTRGPGADAAVDERIDLLVARAAAGECDLVIRVALEGEERAGRRLPDGRYRMDRDADAPLSEAQVRALANTAGQEVTWTCVPPGSGRRLGGDRDGDGWFDTDETEHGSSPTDAASVPTLYPIAIRTTKLVMNDDDREPIDPSKRKITFKSSAVRGVSSGIVVPGSTGTGDPTAAGDGGGGGTLRFYRAADGAALATIPLPAGRWTYRGGSKPIYEYRDTKRESGPIKQIRWQKDSLTISGAGAGLMSLAGAPGGDIVVRLDTGSGFGLCAVVPAKLSGNPPTSAKSDTTAKFLGMPNAPATTCPDPS